MQDVYQRAFDQLVVIEDGAPYYDGYVVHYAVKVDNEIIDLVAAQEINNADDIVYNYDDYVEMLSNANYGYIADGKYIVFAEE